MDIRELNSEKYSGKSYSIKYYTKGYFDIHQEMDAFTFRYCPLEQEEEHILQDEILAGWLCNPIAYGAFKQNKLVGYVEGYLEKWNNRYRISNIAVFDKDKRHAGIGSALFNKILLEARKSGARMAFLETQTCNCIAINFYQKMGFSVIGFDRYAYSNEADNTHEMLVWMGMKL